MHPWPSGYLIYAEKSVFFHFGSPRHTLQRHMVLPSDRASTLGATRLFHGHAAFADRELLRVSHWVYKCMFGDSGRELTG